MRTQRETRKVQREPVETRIPQELSELRRENSEIRMRLAAIERTMKVQNLAKTTAREVELRDRYGRLGLPS